MQKRNRAIHRPNIVDGIAARLRDEIIEGHLRAEARINEVHLAADFGVSRTPLREALGRLVAEGAVTTIPRRGFFTCPLSVEEFEQLYLIRSILDPGALELAGVPSAKRLARLAVLNRKLCAASDAYARIRLDDAWHLELVADCRNQILLDLIQQFMLRTRRYELALMREEKAVRRTFEDHKRILKALRAGNLKEACLTLRKNMQSGTEPVVAWLRDRASKAKAKTHKNGARPSQPVKKKGTSAKR